MVGKPARDHTQARPCRQAIDNALTDAVTQILDLRIPADIDEGQHGQRVDVLATDAPW